MSNSSPPGNEQKEGQSVGHMCISSAYLQVARGPDADARAGHQCGLDPGDFNAVFFGSPKEISNGKIHCIRTGCRGFFLSFFLCDVCWCWWWWCRRCLCSLVHRCCRAVEKGLTQFTCFLMPAPLAKVASRFPPIPPRTPPPCTLPLCTSIPTPPRLPSYM